MIHENVQIQEIDILHIELLVLDHLEFHNDHMKILVFDIIIVIDNSIPIELHHVHDTFTFITTEKTLRSPYNSSFRNSCYGCFSRSNSKT